MRKIAIPVFVIISCLLCGSVSAQPPAQQSPLTVSEALNLLKGQWRFMYKIIDGEIMYERNFRHGSRNQMEVDTNQIHTYGIDQLGRTDYFIDFQNPDGEIRSNEIDSPGSWDLQKVAGGVDIVVRDAYFRGCPEIRRRILRINKAQMLIEDKQTGDQFYFKRAK